MEEADRAARHAQKVVHELDVACAELKSLPRSRPVYQKRGTLFFRSDAEKATRAQQKELEKARSRLKMTEKHRAPP